MQKPQDVRLDAATRQMRIVIFAIKLAFGHGSQALSRERYVEKVDLGEMRSNNDEQLSAEVTECSHGVNQCKESEQSL